MNYGTLKNTALNKIPIDYLYWFLTTDIIKCLAKTTITYAIEKRGTRIDVSRDQMEKYIGISLHMDVVDILTIRCTEAASPYMILSEAPCLGTVSQQSREW